MARGVIQSYSITIVIIKFLLLTFNIPRYNALVPDINRRSLIFGATGSVAAVSLPPGLKQATAAEFAALTSVTLEPGKSGGDSSVIGRSSSLVGSLAYAVVPDSTARLAPSLREEADPVRAVAAGLLGVANGGGGGGSPVRGIFLGEHHDSARDHLLQADLIAELGRASEQQQRGARPRQRGAPRAAAGPAGGPAVAVGLEAVQRRFQPVLDAYLEGTIDEAGLEAGTEWRTRWFWPFERYLPVFRLCKRMGYPLVALNVDSEDLSVVETAGLPGLEPQRLRRYVPDPKAFAAFASTVAFKEYVAYVVAPSYAAHRRMGLLRTTITGQRLDAEMPFANFLAGRLLWDESMATTAAAYAAQHPDTLLVGLVGGDHVKFGCGVPARFARTLAKQGGGGGGGGGDAARASAPTGGAPLREPLPRTAIPLDAVRTVMLNPSPIDTARDPNAPQPPPGSSSGEPALAGRRDDTEVLTLQLRYASIPGDGLRGVLGGDSSIDVPAAVVQGQARGPVLPVADYLWFSKGAFDGQK